MVHSFAVHHFVNTPRDKNSGPLANSTTTMGSIFYDGNGRLRSCSIRSKTESCFSDLVGGFEFLAKQVSEPVLRGLDFLDFLFTSIYDMRYIYRIQKYIPE